MTPQSPTRTSGGTDVVPLAFSTGVPDGHGHRYQADYVDGWAEVAQPRGWTDTDTERLRSLIAGD